MPYVILILLSLALSFWTDNGPSWETLSYQSSQDFRPVVITVKHY